MVAPRNVKLDEVGMSAGLVAPRWCKEDERVSGGSGLSAGPRATGMGRGLCDGVCRLRGPR